MTKQTTTQAPNKKKWHGSKWISKHKRLAIYLRDGLSCCYCGIGIEDQGVMLTLDHVKPRSKGGDNQATNLVTCCQRCNSARQDRPVAEFCRVVAGYINIPAEDVAKRVRNARQRVLPLAEAKAITARRPWKSIMQAGI